jgi:hypothetical protein
VVTLLAALLACVVNVATDALLPKTFLFIAWFLTGLDFYF